MVNQKTVDKTLKFLSEMTHQEAIADDKLALRKFFRNLENFHEIDNYAMDYSDKDFRISLIKGPEERIFRFKTDNTIEEV